MNYLINKKKIIAIYIILLLILIVFSPVFASQSQLSDLSISPTSLQTKELHLAIAQAII